MISEHSAHLTPRSVDFRTWFWRYTCLLLLISMLWHRQAIFKSKRDKLCSSAECRIWTRGPRHQIASRLNARWQTDWTIEDQAKKLEFDSPSLWSASIQLIIITVVCYGFDIQQYFLPEIFVHVTQINEVWHWHTTGMELELWSSNESSS